MDRLARLRRRRDELGRPVRVAVIGAGQMGRGLAAQLGRIDGLELAVAVDRNRDRAVEALRLAGRGAPASGDPARAVADGAAAISDDPLAVAELAVDVVVEATGVPVVGAEVAERCLRAGIHTVMLNVETDATIGLALADIARASGVVYTVADGDEPVCAKELVDLAHELALEVVCAGKGKNNPFIPTATPETCADEAASKRMNPKMLASFQDGSKTMIEMAALANATGLPPDVIGMHGVTAQVDQLASSLIPRRDGGVLSEAGRVDYAYGPAPGVFVVVTTDDPTVAEEMTYLKMGPGPYFTLARPFHLASIEAPRAVITAVLDGRAALQPSVWVAEVVAVAKRDLAPGDVIDGIGGRHVRGVVYPAPAAAGLLLLGLAEGATLTRSVRAGDPVPADAVEVMPSALTRLRAVQDAAVSSTSTDTN
jgi:predicted homoserine dehydrogenase-like protein